MILLDTHVVVWFVDGDARVGEQARERIDAAIYAGDACVSAISFWEVAMLVDKRRLELRLRIDKWTRSILRIRGLRFVSIEPEMAIEAGGLPGGLHGDPADRIIVATARVLRCPLLTIDRRLLAYGAEGHVEACDARL